MLKKLFPHVLVLGVPLMFSMAAEANTRYQDMEALPEFSKNQFFRMMLNREATGCDSIDEIVPKSTNDKGEGRWAVRCGNGESYLVKVLADKRGTLKAENCSDENVSEACFDEAVAEARKGEN